MTIKKVGIALSTWNRAEDLDRCLDLLYKQTYRPFDVYVIDNCSNDITKYVLDKYYNKYNNFEYYIMPHSNFSAIYTINLALKELDNEYVIILDDDTFLEDPYTIEKLVNTADLDKNIAIVATNVRDNFGRASLILKTPLFDAVDYNDISNDDVFDIDDFSGACALFRNDLVGQEFYDESFKIYWNEPDLAIRMVAKGYRVVVNQSIRVTHGSDVGRESCRSFYYGSRNTFRLMTKLLSRKRSLILMGILIPFHLKRYLSMRHENKFYEYLPKVVYCYIENLIRGIFADRIEFNNVDIQNRVYNTYIKYYLKEIMFGLQV
jgi:GT2 family glycosyltransferase